MFKPNFIITPTIAANLMELAALRHAIENQPLTPFVLAGLRESARLSSIHYSTYIEGNRLTLAEVVEVIKEKKHFRGRERDEEEVHGYNQALNYVIGLATSKKNITEKEIQYIHALVMGGGKLNVKPNPYREGQNVIRDAITKSIVYLPPEAQDVPTLMLNLITWINSIDQHLPAPLIAALAHYQFATIHPYFDGNGRSARLLATLLLHLHGYDLKGIYSLEEYYAKDLPGYYEALTIGPSHNYYSGRAEADVTPFLEYFLRTMRESFENVHKHTLLAQKRGALDTSSNLRSLDKNERLILTLFEYQEMITSQDIEKLFNMKPRTARALCQKLVNKGFLVVFNPSKKTRTYALESSYTKLLEHR